jgi:hypothetical protein
MKPLFTLNAGEYLAGNELERRGFVVWIPAKDTGIDLLVSDKSLKRVLPIQVKVSRDFSFEDSLRLHEHVRATGWYTPRMEKVKNSPAAIWMFGIIKQGVKAIDWVIIPPQILYSQIAAVHHKKKGDQHIFIWISEKGRCWETNGLNKSDQYAIAREQYKNTKRELTPYLNDWKAITQALHTKGRYA